MRRLLDLEEERVVLVAALEEHDERAGPDAPDPHDLARPVDDLEPLEELAPVRREGLAVLPELVGDDLLLLLGVDAVRREEVAGGDDHRGCTGDPVAPVMDLRQLREGLQAVAGPGLLAALLQALLELLQLLVGHAAGVRPGLFLVLLLPLVLAG